MMKLTKQTQHYLSILYVIWELLAYYARLFKLDVPSDATKIPVKLSYYEDGVTHLIVEIKTILSAKADKMVFLFG